MKHYAAYYARTAPHPWIQPFGRSLLPVTHRLVTTITTRNMEGAFVDMQGENWSPHGEARPVIERAGVRHTSMSVGDILFDLDTHTYHVCMEMGWYDLPAVPATDDLDSYMCDVKRLADDERSRGQSTYFQSLLSDLNVARRDEK